MRTPGLAACSSAEGERGTYAVEIVPGALAIEVPCAVGLDVRDVQLLELTDHCEHGGCFLCSVNRNSFVGNPNFKENGEYIV